jgi:hypothetical protein
MALSGFVKIHFGFMMMWRRARFHLNSLIWDEKIGVVQKSSHHHARLILIVFFLETLDCFFDLLTRLK